MCMCMHTSSTVNNGITVKNILLLLLLQAVAVQ